jgi:DNA helicase-2/ATP-dependent DNA helicase PcrA
MKALKSKTIGYLDSVGYLYMKGLLEGFDYTPLIKQVVIDEAQDYNITQFAIFQHLFRTAKFTILGDFNQLLNYVYTEDTLTQVHNLFKEDRRSDFIQFDKTYRSSFEITEYVNKILGLNNVNIVRSATGDDVKEHQVSHQDMLNLIADYSDKFLLKDYNSVAVITKNLDDARTLYEDLKDQIKGLHLVDNVNTHHLEGVFIIPSYLAKGLEFDSVIVATSKENKYQDYEKKLYYVVCTRALHDLAIIDEI